ncbi:MAG: site-2 protease family protein, partial [Christensenellaceae bacterium]|nr:site-2 protease family protein [Christensenellaceae bacterium]
RSLKSGAGIAETLLMLLAFLIVIAISVTLHEFAHAFVAFRYGDDTAKLAGRLTLNPLAHFNVMGFISFLLLGFGFAKPVPINSYNFKKYKSGRVAVSLAGIVVNIIIGLVCLLLLYIFAHITFEISSVIWARVYLFVAWLLQYSILINFMLAFFNLLPIAPLDGFNFVDALLPPQNAFSNFMYVNGNKLLTALIFISLAANLLSPYIPALVYFNIFNVIHELIMKMISLVL